MKSKITRLWGIGLAVVLLASMLVAAVPVSAGTLSFTEKVNADIPSTTNKILQSGLDILDIAVSPDGETIYVVGDMVVNAGDHDAILYKSTNGGDTWTLPNATGLSATGNYSLIAMAPDDPDVVVILANAAGATTNLAGWVSTNGGSTFSSLSTITGSSGAAAVLYDLAVSPLSSGERFIAAAGANATGNSAVNSPTPNQQAACLYYFNLGASAPAWHDATNYSGTWTSPTTTGLRYFSAVAFSPNFPSDQVMVAVSTTNTTGSTAGYARLHIASFNQKQWDASVFSSYPVTIETATPWRVTNKADIALDPEYLGGDDTTRIAFVGISANGSSTDGAVGGVFRCKDTVEYDMKTASNIASVAWDGTNLAAGGYDDNNVYRWADALATTPTAATSRGNKEIGIDDTGAYDQTLVRFAGTNLIGVKRGASSAFGVSTDYGKTWNDISLIDTALTQMQDIYVSPDGSVVYLISDDSSETSVWRQASSWKRILTLDNDYGYIVRADNDNPSVVYIADSANKTMYYSTDGGLEKWTVRASRYNIADMAVQDADIAYVANAANDEISKTTNGGFTWGSDVDSLSLGGTCFSLTLIADDQLLMGTTTGYISYSADGNGSWTKIGTQLNYAGPVQLTADGLADGNYIYASTNGTGRGVERWQIGQAETAWKDLLAPSTSNQCYGLTLANGILYGLTSNGTNSALVRTLSPTTDTPASSYWSSIASTGHAYTAAPSSMRVSSGSTVIWTLDQTGGTNGLYTLTDTLSTVGPTLGSPANNYQNPINPVNGNSQDIAFSWNKPTTGSIAYEVKIYASDGTTNLITGTKAATDLATPNLLIGPNQAANTLNFAPGATYYWKVRTSTPVYSPYSETRSFTIQPLGAQVPAVLSPANGGSITNQHPAFSWSPVSGATEYQFQLAYNPTFAVPIIDEKTSAAGLRPTVDLDTDLTYFWRVRATKPVMGDWSAMSNFYLEKPVEAAPPIEIIQTPPPVIQIPAAPPAQQIVIPPAPQPPAQIAPAYIWAIIIIGAVLVIAVIVLIVRTRRTV